MYPLILGVFVFVCSLWCGLKAKKIF